MLPSEFQGIIHFPSSENEIPMPENFCTIQSYNETRNPIFNRYSYGGYRTTSLTPSLSNNNSTSSSTSDEGDELPQLRIIDDRKQRRMISNRESARRSRMRKQKHLNELWSQMVCLCNENHQLMEKLNRLTAGQEKLLQENAKLKEEVSDFHQMLTHLQISNPFETLKE